MQLIFQVPSFVKQEIFPLSSEQERALAAEGVIRLTCGDYQFAVKVCSYLVHIYWHVLLMCSHISLLYDKAGSSRLSAFLYFNSCYTIKQSSHVASVQPKKVSTRAAGHLFRGQNSSSSGPRPSFTEALIH